MKHGGFLSKDEGCGVPMGRYPITRAYCTYIDLDQSFKGHEVTSSLHTRWAPVPSNKMQKKHPYLHGRT